MARRECEPPFEATETQIKLTEPMHLKTLFPDDEVDAAVLATFGSKCCKPNYINEMYLRLM